VQSRRQLLERAFAIPIALRSLERSVPCSPTLACRVISEPDSLSEESASGYRLMIERHRPRFPIAGDVLVFAAARNISKHRLLRLRSLVLNGMWLIWERSPFIDDPQQFIHEQQLFREIFGLRITRPRAAHYGTGTTSYVQYHWPAPALVRAFTCVTPIECQGKEAIAHYEEKAVAAKKRIGRGGIIFLGSLLGPHLQAEDREASRLAAGLLELAS
jgi:hypothetical protein